MTQLLVHSFDDVGKPVNSKHYLVRSRLSDGKANLCTSKISVKMVLSGSETYTASGVRHAIRTGQFLVAIPGETYEVEIPSAATGCCFYFDADTLHGFMAEILSADLSGSCTRSPELHTIRLPLPGSALGQSLAAVANSTTDADFNQLSVLLAERLIHLSVVKSRLPLRRESAKTELLARLELARNCLVDMKNSHVSLRQLEKISCLSRYHLVRSFTLAYGVPPLRFHQNLKLDDSLKNIKSGMPVNQAAKIAGFASASTFSRAFRRRHLCPPTGITQK